MIEQGWRAWASNEENEQLQLALKAKLWAQFAAAVAPGLIVNLTWDDTGNEHDLARTFGAIADRMLAEYEKRFGGAKE